MVSLEDAIFSLGKDNGADYIGVADLASLSTEIIRQGGEFVRPYQRAIVFGISLLDPLVDGLFEPGTRAAKISYRHHAYQVINARIDMLGSRIAGLIQEQGFPALPVPASERVDDTRLCSFFSHKLAARQAGLGWIGKNCLLVTPENGPRVRWGSVLTTALLPASSGLVKDRCGRCHACVDACPVQAFTGESFREEDPREVRYAAEKCDQFFRDLRERQEEAVCGLCLAVCPYGKRHSRRRGTGTKETSKTGSPSPGLSRER